MTATFKGAYINNKVLCKPSTANNNVNNNVRCKPCHHAHPQLVLYHFSNVPGQFPMQKLIAYKALPLEHGILLTLKR